MTCALRAPVAGPLGSACAGAVLAEAAAIDNFMDDCGECNEKYYQQPPCLRPPANRQKISFMMHVMHGHGLTFELSSLQIHSVVMFMTSLITR